MTNSSLETYRSSPSVTVLNLDEGLSLKAIQETLQILKSCRKLSSPEVGRGIDQAMLRLTWWLSNHPLPASELAQMLELNRILRLCLSLPVR